MWKRYFFSKNALFEVFFPILSLSYGISVFYDVWQENMTIFTLFSLFFAQQFWFLTMRHYQIKRLKKQIDKADFLLTELLKDKLQQQLKDEH